MRNLSLSMVSTITKHRGGFQYSQFQYQVHIQVLVNLGSNLKQDFWPGPSSEAQMTHKVGKGEKM